DTVVSAVRLTETVYNCFKDEPKIGCTGKLPCKGLGSATPCGWFLFRYLNGISDKSYKRLYILCCLSTNKKGRSLLLRPCETVISDNSVANLRFGKPGYANQPILFCDVGFYFRFGFVFVVRLQVTKHRADNQGKYHIADHANHRVELHPRYERCLRHVEHRRAKLTGEFGGGCDRTTKRFLNGVCRFRRNPVGQGSRDLRAVDGDSQTTEHCQPRRATQLRAGFRNRRCCPRSF